MLRDMVRDSVTRAVDRIGVRVGGRLVWTPATPRAGLVTAARRQGKAAVTIADQGGWARHSCSMNGCSQLVDGWEDNDAAGLPDYRQSCDRPHAMDRGACQPQP